MMLAFVVFCLLVSSIEPYRVGIIGSGIGGAASAWFIRDLLQDQVEITVFEKNDAAGGRMKSIPFEDGQLELGGSIGIQKNKYFFELSERMGLNRTSPFYVDGKYAVHNGIQIIYQTSTWKAGTMFGMLRRYGMSSLAVQLKVKSAVNSFSQIYDLQAQGKWFRSSAELWEAISLLDLSKNRLNDTLLKAFSSPIYSPVKTSFVNEFVSSITHINYLQSPSTMNALAGLIALAPLNTATDEVFRVEQGNSQFAAKLLEDSKSKVYLNHQVTNLVKTTDQKTKWIVSVAEKPESFVFDAIVIAAPFEQSAITIEAETAQIPSNLPYQSVYTTYIKGKLQPEYFGVKSANHIPTNIGSTRTMPFASFSILKKMTKDSCLVKFFSEDPLHESLLSAVFAEGFEVIANQTWQAYPKFRPSAEMPDFILDDCMYYVNAIETGASCIEISAISAKNIALMLNHDLRGKSTDEKQTTAHDL